MTHARISGYKNIDMDKMISSITREINSFWSLYDPVGDESKMCLIYRVPEHIYEIDRIAYEPMVVSFGPYHCGAHHLQDMEKHKWKYLDRVLKLNNKITLHDYIKEIAGFEKRARKCYSEEIKMERKKFLQMLLLDACFILVNIDENVGKRVFQTTEGTVVRETLTDLRESPGGIGQRKGKEHENTLELELIKVEASPERSRNNELENINNAGDWMGCCAWHDMFLLENQIPFFVVESIYELVAGQDIGVESLRCKAAEVVADILRHYPTQELDRPCHFHHLLHLCHLYLRPSSEIDGERQHPPKLRYFHELPHLGYKYLAVGRNTADVEKKLDNLDQQVDCFQAGKLRTRWRRAEEYHRAGIRFKTREFDGQRRHSLLDIRFMDGIIEVPRLPIDEGTESLFKNLVALEQTDTRYGNDISSYVTFMSQVVATPDDATMFVQKGIIVHMMHSDEEVSDLFARITKQVSFRFHGRYYLKSLCQMLEAHYQSRLNRWIAWLWLNHFGNPWLALAALAAGVVVVCTIVQTIYTVLAYVKPPSGV